MIWFDSESLRETLLSASRSGAEFIFAQVSSGAFTWGCNDIEAFVKSRYVKSKIGYKAFKDCALRVEIGLSPNKGGYWYYTGAIKVLLFGGSDWEVFEIRPETAEDFESVFVLLGAKLPCGTEIQAPNDPEQLALRTELTAAAKAVAQYYADLVSQHE